MRNSKTFFLGLAKKIPLILMLILVNACNSSSNQMADGLGGTGITIGRTTAFGSIYVNGIKFDTDNAVFIRNGKSAQGLSDFSAGEIVKIVGQRNEENKIGIASKVTFSNILQGTLTSLAVGNSIELLGQTITTDKLTLFHGFKNLADLSLNNKIEVSGFVTPTGIIATSIKLLEQNFTAGDISKLEGYIYDLDSSAQTFKINQLVINYSAAQFKKMTNEAIKNGIYLTVSSTEALENNTLKATLIDTFNNLLEIGEFYEIEGYVNQQNTISNVSVELGDFLPDTILSVEGSLADGMINSDANNNNSHIIVTGTFNDQNVLVANEVKTLNNRLEILLKAPIEAIDHTSNSLVVSGESIKINNFTLFSDDTSEAFVSLNLQQFSIGEMVLVSAYQEGKDFIANRLSKVTPVANILLSAPIDAVDSDTYTLSLLGIKISIIEDTTYFDENGNPLTKENYFSRLEMPQIKIKVVGQQLNEKEVIATQLSLILN